METCSTIKSIRSQIKTYKSKIGSDDREPSVGFVPTMGYLHRGHISLVEHARKKCDIVVVSIFVNPTQFASNEDLSVYPTDLRSDTRLLEEAKADLLFTPSVKEIYGDNASTFVEVTSMQDVLESKARPGHFRGVATVVTKLLNIVQPDIMFIGQKDAMQCVCLRNLIFDLAFNTEILVCNTVRESNGLAMSSRNSYLTQSEREEASLIYRFMNEMRQFINSTNRDRLIATLTQNIVSGCSKMTVEYVSLASSNNGKELPNGTIIEVGSVLSLAVFFNGKRCVTRLIDAIIL